MTVILLSVNKMEAQDVLGPAGGFGNRMGQNQNRFEEDTTFNKPKSKWKNIPPKIYYKVLNSEVRRYIDTSIENIYQTQYPNFHTRHLGNYGSPMKDWKIGNLSSIIGPHLSYPVYNAYQYHILDVPYYNTTRPYSLFTYTLGSKQEQTVSINHTQNITRYWNVALQVKNINSPGYYRGQYATYNGGYLTTNYKSNNQRYTLNAAIVYNRNNVAENGGIISDTLLTDSRLIEKLQIPILFDNAFTGANRSNIFNVHQSIKGLLSHHYSWGVADTLYNQDSTAMTPRFTPRFRLTHEFLFTAEQHQYNDRVAEEKYYTDFVPSTVQLVRDTLRQNLRWTQYDNKFTINGFVGKAEKLIQLNAGIGNAIDVFNDRVKENGSRNVLVNNYIVGNMLKEAKDSTQWEYGAKVKFIFAGSSIGDLHIEGAMGKYIKNIGGFKLSAMQMLQTPAYNYGIYTTNQFTMSSSLEKMSMTKLSATLYVPFIGLSIEGNNLLMGNYVYWDNSGRVQQYNKVFNVIQIQGSHKLKVKYWTFNNEILVQKNVGFTPINFPLVMLQHTTAYQRRIFKNKLLMNTGINIKYYTPHQGGGYNPFVNQFTYLSANNSINNVPEVLIYASIKVKTLRLFASADQLQQLVFKKNVMHYPLYPMQDALFRFGFQWFLYN